MSTATGLNRDTCTGRWCWSFSLKWDGNMWPGPRAHPTVRIILSAIAEDRGIFSFKPIPSMLLEKSYLKDIEFFEDVPLLIFSIIFFHYSISVLNYRQMRHLSIVTHHRPIAKHQISIAMHHNAMYMY